ncbi:hypothetical protein DFH94DRAFT_644559, partial [Russula ochroleuca]
MKLRDMACTRCHKEKDEHRYDAANDADPGDIPPELHDILDGITQMEEMLCSLASPCFLMWDISQLCTTLPRL